MYLNPGMHRCTISSYSLIFNTSVSLSHLSHTNPLATADGDPHFVVEFPLSKLTVCFNINGEPGHILRMVSDHKHSGKTVLSRDSDFMLDVRLCVFI